MFSKMRLGSLESSLEVEIWTLLLYPDQHKERTKDKVVNMSTVRLNA